jgi:hypothetical protein
MLQKIKITRSHTSTTDATAEIIKALKKLKEVSKISIGIIKPTTSKGGKRAIKFLPITGGIVAIIRGSGTVQELYIYTSEIDFVKNYLLKVF